MKAILIVSALSTFTTSLGAQRLAPSLSKEAIFEKKRNAVVVDGTVETILAGGASSAPKSGSLGLTHVGPSLTERFAAFISVAASRDALSAEGPRPFGRALLAGAGSGSSSALSTFSAEYQRFNAIGDNGNGRSHGPRAYASYAQSTWRSEQAGLAAIESDVGMVSAGARWFWTPISEQSDGSSNSLIFTAEFGITTRYLAGEGADSPEFLERTLGVNRRGFWGPEFVATIQVRQLSAFFGLTHLLKGRRPVTGLTGLQPTFGFSLDAPFIVF